MASADRCIVPDYDGNTMTYDKRTSLAQQSVSGATYYIYNNEIVMSSMYGLTRPPYVGCIDTCDVVYESHSL